MTDARKDYLRSKREEEQIELFVSILARKAIALVLPLVSSSHRWGKRRLNLAYERQKTMDFK
jgi:hypothetical protein